MAKSSVKEFLKRKNVNITVQTYLIDALGAMAFGLFASLLIGTIFGTLGQQFQIEIFNVIADYAKSATGAALGIAIAHALKAPQLVLFSAATVGIAGNALGGPVGALVATIVAAELGKIVSKETRLDIIVTPGITIISGVLVAQFVGRAQAVGFSQTTGTALLSIAAVIGIVASYIWGVLDTKMGTKFASILLALWFAIAILLNILPGQATFVVSAVFLGCALGGNTNFSTSMCASLFGRKNFQRAFNFVFPVSCIFRAAASVVLGVVLGATGGNYVAAYMVFLIGSVIAMILFGCINMTPKKE